MRNTFKIAILILLLVSTFSCGNKEFAIKSDNKTVYIDMIVNNYGDGRVYGEKPAAYIEYETMNKSVICAKPNCKHFSSECIGYIIGDTPIMTDNGINFFNFVQGVNELKNGEREHYINSKLCRVTLDSSEVEDIVEFHDCAPREFDGCLLYNNKIYFTGDDLDPTPDEYGNIFASNVGGNHYLCSIDLDTKEYKNYGSVFDGENSEKSSAAIIEGYYNSKIIISYQYRENLDSEEISVKMFEFDPETDEFEEIDIPMPVHVDTETIIYYDPEKKKSVILKNDEKTELDINVGSWATIQNNKLFVRDEEKWYDLSDMSAHSMGEYGRYVVIDYYDNCYIMIHHTKTLKLTEEELLALDKEK